MEKLIELLKTVNSSIDYENEKALISDGLLDSLEIITIVNMICDEFDCDIDISDLEPENMDSVQAIWEMINE